MCSCPPAGANLCYICGHDHHFNRTNAIPPRGTLSAFPASLLTMPDGVSCLIVSFVPDSSHALKEVCKKLAQIGEKFLGMHARAIVRECSRADSSLYSLVCSNFQNFNQRLVTRQDCSYTRFHASILIGIRSLGVPPAGCSDRILSLVEIREYGLKIAGIEDSDLQKVWEFHLHQVVVTANPGLPDVPAANASAQGIRTWMHARPAALLGVTTLDLSRSYPASVPKEIGLCTSLQDLRLHNNRLFSFPESAFHGLTALQYLALSGNRFTSLPKMAFQGLTALQTLSLFGNRLVSLPEMTFQGLTALTYLDLSDNQLVFLPEGIFQGLTSLGRLSLHNNRFAFFPERTFHGLPALYDLCVSGNPRLLPRFSSRRQVRTEFLGTMNTFFNYTCTSSFARFYKLAATGASLEALRQDFSGLPDGIKNDLYCRIWCEAGNRYGLPDRQWGKDHAWDDMQIFYAALKSCVTDCFGSLTPDQRVRVCEHVQVIAQNEKRGAELVNFSEGATQHAMDNVLRLIDALCHVLERWQR